MRIFAHAVAMVLTTALLSGCQLKSPSEKPENIIRSWFLANYAGTAIDELSVVDGTMEPTSAEIGYHFIEGGDKYRFSWKFWIRDSQVVQSENDSIAVAGAGPILTEAHARDVAQKMVAPIYGERVLRRHLPLLVSRAGQEWAIVGHVDKQSLGGDLALRIDSATGKLVAISLAR
jgi:hypothetical protein